MNKKGKVFLVGAGPGHPDFLTVRGVQLLSTADVVVVDDLVDSGVLLYAQKAKIIDAGKRGPGSPMGANRKKSQGAINRLLIRLARDGKRVVRLKGGDPFVFGRGGEEMEALRRNNIPYEIVPGVTSALAAPLGIGIPLSDRRWASAITLVTGQESQQKSKKGRREWSVYQSNGTLVILMGVSQWPAISRELLSAGWPLNTPVSAIQSASWKNQKSILTTLSSSSKVFHKKELRSPAVIVVGQVAALADSMETIFSQKPLLGQKVISTRPGAQGRELNQLLRDQGAFVLLTPALQIRFRNLDSLSREFLFQLKQRAPVFDWLVFFSENGVAGFHKNMKAMPPTRIRIAAVGNSTAEALREKGLPVHRISVSGSSEKLFKAHEVRGKRFLLIRVAHGPSRFPAFLEKNGAKVLEWEIYESLPAPQPSEIKRNFIVDQSDFVIFTSSRSVESFLNWFTPMERKLICKSKVAISIGPATSQTCKKLGWADVRQARKPYTEEISACLQEAVKKINS